VANAQAVEGGQLQIATIKGEGSEHIPRDKVGSEIQVQVLDELQLPKQGVEVTFEAPDDPNKPSVRFGINKTSAKAMTNDLGFASVKGVFGNGVRGPVTIKVSATFEEKTATAEIKQSNVRGPFWNRRTGEYLGGALATIGVVLYEILKPGPPTATVQTPTSSTQGPSGTTSSVRRR
jgi:hypothetical protein